MGNDDYKPLTDEVAKHDIEEPVSDKQLKEMMDESPQERFLYNQVALNKGISKLNFYSYLLFTLVPHIVLQPVHYMHQPLLAVVYGLDFTQQRNLAAILHTFQIIFKFIFAPILGFFCDRFARKPFMIVGVVVAGVTTGIQANLPGIYPWFIINYIIHDFGNACSHIVPLLADYVHDSTKARVAGAVVMLAAVISWATTLLGTKMNINDNIPLKFQICGAFATISGLIIIIFGVKGGAYHLAHHARRRKSQMILRRRSQMILVHKLQDGKSDPNAVLNAMANLPKVDGDYAPGFMAGIKQARKHPWILIAFIAEFLAITHFNSMGSMYTTYLVELDGHQSAARQALVLKNQEQFVQIFAALFFGFFSDKYNKFHIMMIVIMTSLFGTYMVTIMPSPYSWHAYAAAFFFGFTNSGFRTLIHTILAKYPDPKYRASVHSVNTIVAALSAVMIGVFGVQLAKIDALIPYYLCIGFVFMCVPVMLWMYSRNMDYYKYK